MLTAKGGDAAVPPQSASDEHDQCLGSLASLGEFAEQLTVRSRDGRFASRHTGVGKALQAQLAFDGAIDLAGVEEPLPVSPAQPLALGRQGFAQSIAQPLRSACSHRLSLPGAR